MTFSFLPPSSHLIISSSMLCLGCSESDPDLIGLQEVRHYYNTGQVITPFLSHISFGDILSSSPFFFSFLPHLISTHCCVCHRTYWLILLVVYLVINGCSVQLKRIVITKRVLVGIPSHRFISTIFWVLIWYGVISIDGQQ
jgi:hypothetical protein